VVANRKKTSRQKSKRFLGKRGGYSLVEITISLALLVLIASLTIPTPKALEKVALQNEIATLKSRLLFLQQKAITSNRKQKLKFLHNTNQYSYKRNGETHASMEIVHRFPSSISYGFFENTKGPPSSPKKPLTSPITFQKQKITFLPSGYISPGTVYLVNKKASLMVALSIPVSQIPFIREYTSHTRNSGTNGKKVIPQEPEGKALSNPPRAIRTAGAAAAYRRSFETPVGSSGRAARKAFPLRQG